jgi:hypothetical protein
MITHADLTLKDGYSYGDGVIYGDGHGYGYGYGSGYGYGYGDGYGSGYGVIYGYGYGSGFRSGYGCGPGIGIDERLHVWNPLIDRMEAVRFLVNNKSVKRKERKNERTDSVSETEERRPGLLEPGRPENRSGESSSEAYHSREDAPGLNHKCPAQAGVDPGRERADRPGEFVACPHGLRAGGA